MSALTVDILFLLTKYDVMYVKISRIIHRFFSSYFTSSAVLHTATPIKNTNILADEVALTAAQLIERDMVRMGADSAVDVAKINLETMRVSTEGQKYVAENTKAVAIGKNKAMLICAILVFAGFLVNSGSKFGNLVLAAANATMSKSVLPTGGVTQAQIVASQPNSITLNAVSNDLNLGHIEKIRSIVSDPDLNNKAKILGLQKALNDY